MGRLNYALFDDLDIPGIKTMISCTSCGMICDDVPFNEQQLREYYRCNEHYAASSLGGSGSLTLDNQNRYDRIIDLLQPDSGETILDVGCGQGGFMARCLQRRVCATGIEPSEKSRTAVLRAGLEVYSSIDEYAEKCPNVSIGTVVLSHVLEHLLEPRKILEDLVRIAPGAKVYMEVPDAVSYISPDSMRWHELYFEHLNHFSEDSLSLLVADFCAEAGRAESTSFSETLSDIRCLSLCGIFKRHPDQTAERFNKGIVPEFKLPAMTCGDLPQDDRPVAVWGISQYAMLLMGSLPQLRHIDRLFDASPAKIGRKIRGVVIEDSKEIRNLDAGTRLVLPYSQYSDQMLRELDDTALFAGEIVHIESSGNIVTFSRRR
jgi:SAM-dependent methyltransferase